jgi:uncharacterized protein (TIGR00299 family) protein
MTIAYFDCFSGVAGDMVLGALIDAGLPMAHLRRELAKLKMSGYALERRRTMGHSRIKGTNLHVKVSRELPDIRFTAISHLIESSKLKSSIKDKALGIMVRLAKAESQVHNVPVSEVHFHEVGGVDSIVDCVGAAIGFDYFEFEQVTSSPLPITRGRVKCAHGTLPVPAPATMQLIKGVPVEPAPIKDEIVTPTGAAILTSIVTHFGECPLQRVEKVGYGYGDKVFSEIPNALRLLIGEGFPVVVIEATIDDMNPQIFDYAMERLFEAGAVDITLQAVQMKKNRPATVIACQAPWKKKDAVIEALLKETTTTGVRYHPAERRMLTREMTTIKTKLGNVRIKIAKDEKLGIEKKIPEYEDMKKIAKRRKIPLIEVYKTILVKL